MNKPPCSNEKDGCSIINKVDVINKGPVLESENADEGRCYETAIPQATHLNLHHIVVKAQLKNFGLPSSATVSVMFRDN